MKNFFKQWRNVVALVIVVLIAVVDSVNWFMSLAADLLLALILYAVLTFWRSDNKGDEVK